MAEENMDLQANNVNAENEDSQVGNADEMAVEANSRKTMHIQVTPLQMDTIRQLFIHNDWDLVEMPPSNDGTHAAEVNTEGGLAVTTSSDTSQDDIPGFQIPQVEGRLECSHCLCKPCITDECNRQLWWPTEDQGAFLHNHKQRKEAYKRFWTMLFHRNVWNDTRYIERKCDALGVDPGRNHYGWIHRRDIMPDCVIDLVRGWYPNPKGVQYMGHKWE